MASTESLYLLVSFVITAAVLPAPPSTSSVQSIVVVPAQSQFSWNTDQCGVFLISRAFLVSLIGFADLRPAGQWVGG